MMIFEQNKVQKSPRTDVLGYHIVCLYYIQLGEIYHMYYIYVYMYDYMYTNAIIHTSSV